ncbi:biopolymer transporter ExbD [Allopontixanthobacter sp.]|uniref:ExbD/TolR family protein n=1 Tax=Allopontixanthobacter sp. TaxID=2906452 RepID=UPI002ABB112E|nr:biopolymer transporter ExbD [Allopontixanthobacter sp.]MDZ4308874.1 biopolymer transporter ExbD [Allopontixanthobacter sp.]
MAASFVASAPGTAPQPMGAMNTTPLIDVMLVLLIMFIITIPVATHSVDLNLPRGDVVAPLFADKNKVVIDAQDRIYWNGQTVTETELASLLRDTLLLDVEPELQFEPDAMASYRVSARMLNTIKASGVTKFGFVGTERYREFGK